MFEDFEEAVKLHILNDTAEHKDSNRVIITALALFYTIKSCEQPEKSYEEFEMESLLDGVDADLRQLLTPIVKHLFERHYLVDLEVINKFIMDIKLTTILEDCIRSKIE